MVWAKNFSKIVPLKLCPTRHPNSWNSVFRRTVSRFICQGAVSYPIWAFEFSCTLSGRSLIRAYESRNIMNRANLSSNSCSKSTVHMSRCNYLVQSCTITLYSMLQFLLGSAEIFFWVTWFLHHKLICLAFSFSVGFHQFLYICT